MNKFRNAGLTALLFFILISCTDDPFKVGFKLLPDVDLLEAGSDTLAVKGYVATGYPGIANSLNLTAANAKIDKCPLGHVIDPVFGSTWAEIIFEMKYGENKYKYDSLDEFISCKLYLKIEQDLTFGGDNGFNLNLYPLTKRLNYKNSTSYTVKSEDFDLNQNLSETVLHNLYYNRSDIPGLDSNTYYLVINLNDTYFSGLIDSNLKTESILITKFPGFYIKPYAINEIGGIENFLFEGSHFIMEYNRTYKDKNKNDSIVTEFSNYNMAKYQGIFRNESNFTPVGPFGGLLGDTLNEAENIYIQSLGGIRGYIHIPELEILKQTKSDTIGINFAEIVFPVNSSHIDTINFYLPPRISLLDKIPGGFQPIIDDNSSKIRNPGYFSGYLNKETMEYKVNITEYAHRYLQGDSKSTGWFYISPSKMNSSTFSSVEYKAPGRAVLNSGGSANPPYLRIIYTNTNN